MSREVRHKLVLIDFALKQIPFLQANTTAECPYPAVQPMGNWGNPAKVVNGAWWEGRMKLSASGNKHLRPLG